MVLFPLFLLLLSTFASTCLQHSRNHIQVLFPSLVHLIREVVHLRLQAGVLRRVVRLVAEAVLVDAAAVVDVLGGGEAQQAESESEGTHVWSEWRK